MAKTEQKFEIDAVHHLAMVCKDMQATVEFYTKILGFRLVKTVDIPGGRGQHFFLEYAPGQSIAFFYFPGAPEQVKGLTGPGFGRLDAEGNMLNRISGNSAHGTMHHVAFRVPLENIQEYRDRLARAGLAISDVVHHGDRRTDPETSEVRDEDFALSIYFSDPDGICLEFCAYTRELREDDIVHTPARAGDVEVAHAPAAALATAY